MFPASRQPPASETDVSHFHGTTLLSPIRVEMNRHGPPSWPVQSVSVTASTNSPETKHIQETISGGLFTHKSPAYR